MCTFTFVPTDSYGLILTSSRDEVNSRPTALPSAYKNDKQTCFYPKDLVAGGTWLAVSDQGRVVCLLNGAFNTHVHTPPYTRSRGLIPLEALAAETVEGYWDKVDLNGVEPFTLIAVQQLEEQYTLQEMRWDGSTKYTLKLDETQTHIWSSATLYNENQRKQRSTWFQEWIENTENWTPQQMYKFHNSKHGEDGRFDLVMQRQNGLETTSLSQLVLTKNKGQFYHFDRLESTEKELSIRWQQTPKLAVI
jgi:uncharacterized protein with NRDE domain